MTESASPASSAGRGSPVPSAVVAIEQSRCPLLLVSSDDDKSDSGTSFRSSRSRSSR